MKDKNLMMIIARQKERIIAQEEIHRRVIGWIFRDARRTSRFTTWWWNEVKKKGGGK